MVRGDEEPVNRGRSNLSSRPWLSLQGLCEASSLHHFPVCARRTPRSRLQTRSKTYQTELRGQKGNHRGVTGGILCDIGVKR